MAKRGPDRRAGSGTPPRFDLAALRRIADAKSFERGVEYFEAEAVAIVTVDEERVRARVVGSEHYRTELRGTGAKFSGTCTCPAFSDGRFCKHLVATALAANDAGGAQLSETANRLVRIREHLRAQPVEALVETIMGIAELDEALLRSLDLASSAATGDRAVLLARFRKAIDEATATPGYVDYREAEGWADGAEAVLEQISALVEHGQPDAALELLPRFFDNLEEAVESIDDSDGELTGLAERALEIHRAACRAAPPDPATLAAELFEREADNDFDWFYGASETYAEILGEAGLAEYRRLAEAAWARIKPPEPGRAGADHRLAYDDRRIMGIVDRFAERDGDLARRIALRTKDLSVPYAYQDVAEICLAHGRDDEAVKWIEEGLWRFEDERDRRLLSFAADLYARVGRAADAERLLRGMFEHEPDIMTYRDLKSVVSEEAVMSLTDWAIAIVEARVAGASARPPQPAWAERPHDLLVDILMEEGRLGHAWRAVHAHGCGDRRLAQLAAASEASVPEEAIAAYAAIVERTVGRTNQASYEEACRLLDRIGVIRERIGETQTHRRYLVEVAARHKAKRNFVKLLQARSEIPRRAG
jgi:uncharacterized Zn finger protein